MTSTEILVHRQAIAVERGTKLAASLDPLNKSLRLAIDEPLPNDTYLLAETAAALGQVCLQQREHITELAERIEKLEAQLPVANN